MAVDIRRRKGAQHGGRMECGGVHASCRLYRQSIGRDRVWRDGPSSRFTCGVPGPEGCWPLSGRCVPLAGIPGQNYTEPA
jgi:hypothetical protein